ncbi:MAG: GNAT family N-acetyltransferase [Promethearchaeota archaeon]
MSAPESREITKKEKRKRLRTFFLNLGNRIEDFLKAGMRYIEMKLPMDKITEDFIRAIERKSMKISEKLKIRIATEKDISSIKEIYNAAWKHSPMPFRPITEEKLMTIYNEESTLFFIASMNNTDVGFMLIDFEEENEKKFGIISGLGILPEYQNLGIGTTLGLHSYYYFKEKGVEELRCEVHVDNEISYKFIKGLGFEEFNEKFYRENDFLLKW